MVLLDVWAADVSVGFLGDELMSMRFKAGSSSLLSWKGGVLRPLCVFVN